LSFKISGEERQFLSQLIRDQESKASGLAPCHLYHRRESEQRFRTHAWYNA
jgi:predicted glycosyltransferase involved in capsule biosynthesis